MTTVWIANLIISPRTEAKIVGRHQIQCSELRDAIVCRRGLQFVIDSDEERGERVIIQTTIRGRAALVVLYDARHPLGDVWHLGSVYFVD